MVKTSRRSGFTIIEISLFLALSGLLMIGLIAGTNASISRQRYNDAANNFAEFLRTAYNDVANISGESDTGGNSKYAVYGKLLTFGESGTGAGEVRVYDVVGYAVNSSNIVDSETLTILSKVGANIVYDVNEGGLATEYKLYRQSSYTAPWEASLEKPDVNERYKGTILIVRSPVSGLIQTYQLENIVPEISNTVAEGGPLTQEVLNGLFKKYLTDESDRFQKTDIDICVDSADNSGLRRDIRIDKNAINSSGVIMVARDSDDNPCGDRALAGNPPVE